MKNILQIFNRTIFIYILLGSGLYFVLDKDVLKGNFLAHTKDFGQYLNDFHHKRKEYHEEKFKKGVVYYKALSEYVKAPALCLGNIAFAQFYNRNIEEAIDVYRKAIEMEPRWYSFYYDLGIILFFIDDIQRAIPFFEQALALIPKTQEDYFTFLRRSPSVKNKQLNKEIAFLHQRSRFDHQELYLYLSRGYAQKEDYGKLLEVSLEGVKMYMGNAELNFYVGLSLYRAGTYAEAVNYFTRSVTLDANFSESYYYRGLCAQKMGEEAVYAAEVNKALQTKDKTKIQRNNPFTELHVYPDMFHFFKIYSLTDWNKEGGPTLIIPSSGK